MFVLRSIKLRYLKFLIAKHGNKNGVPPELVARVILQESGCEVFAARYEPAFFERYIKDNPDLPGYFPKRIPTAATERRLRAFSFGLMQILGETAREAGFKHRWLAMLFIPSINVKLGCKILGKHFRRARGNEETALLKYNGGGNKGYPGQVAKQAKNPLYKKLVG